MPVVVHQTAGSGVADEPAAAPPPPPSRSGQSSPFGGACRSCCCCWTGVVVVDEPPGSPPPPAASAAGTPTASEPPASSRTSGRRSRFGTGHGDPPRRWWSVHAPPRLAPPSSAPDKPGGALSGRSSRAPTVARHAGPGRGGRAPGRGRGGARAAPRGDGGRRRRPTAASRSTRRAWSPTTSSCSTATCPASTATTSAARSPPSSPRTKVLMLTAARSTDDLVAGPRARGRRLPAQAVPLRRAGRPPARARAAAPARRARRSCTAADVELDPARHTAARGGRDLGLTPKEFAVLEVAARRAGRGRQRRRARRAGLGRAARPALQHGPHDGDDPAPQAGRPAAARDGARGGYRV